MKDLSAKESIELLSKNYIGRIAYIAKGNPEIIPITYHYDPEHHSILTYSSAGAKIEAMRKNRTVAFQVDDVTSLNNWRSVLIHGTFEELSGIDAKHILHQFAEGVKQNIRRQGITSPRFIHEFSSKTDTQGIPIVYRINISEITGKQRIS